MKSRLFVVSAAAILVAAFAWTGCGSDDSDDGGAGAAGASGKGGSAGKGGGVNKGGSNQGGSNQGGANQGGSAQGGSGQGGSAGGSTGCTDIFEPGECATCLETTCCDEISACNAAAGCLECFDDASTCADDATYELAAKMTDCLNTKCTAPCGVPETACQAPVEAPSKGYCVEIDTAAGIACNPVTGAPCDLAAGETCDFAEGGFGCYEAPNDAKNCEACDGYLGPYCAAGMTCAFSKCARFCCDDSDCGGGSAICDKTLTGADYGLCIVGDGDAGTPPPPDAAVEAAVEAAAEAAVEAAVEAAADDAAPADATAD